MVWRLAALAASLGIELRRQQAQCLSPWSRADDKAGVVVVARELVLARQDRLHARRGVRCDLRERRRKQSRPAFDRRRVGQHLATLALATFKEHVAMTKRISGELKA